MHARRWLALALAFLMVAPALVDRAPSVAAASIPIETLLQTSVNDLGTPPLALTMSRVVLTPGASDDEAIDGLRLVIVESGSLRLMSAQAIDVTHNEQAMAGTAVSGSTSPLTPTPNGSATADFFLDPDDSYPVPIQLMTSLSNIGDDPATIIDIRLSSGQPLLPPADLDSETLASVTDLTTLPAGPVSVGVGRGTLAAGDGIAAAGNGSFQFVAPAMSDGSLTRQSDGSATNAGTSPLDVYVLSIASVVAAVPSPPSQPATGPGGAEVAFDQVVIAHKTSGQGGDYTLFEPAAPRQGIASPTAETPLPIVIFFAAACCDATAIGGTYDPPYQDWIDHIVRRGAVVIEPSFSIPHDVDDVVVSLRAALTELQNGHHPPTDPTHIVAFGHSYGSPLAAEFTAVAAAKGLPVPVGLLLTEPGCGCPIGDLGTIPASTRIVIVVGSEDAFGDEGGREIWAKIGQIPNDRKDYVTLLSDDHGQPALVADHPMPATAEWGPLDALDWYGTWKLFDALSDCTIAGQGCDTNFGDTPAERFMGDWSDGVPVHPAVITDDPGAPASTPVPAA